MSRPNTNAGSRIAIGDAVLEVTTPPHTGCTKFVARFGEEAMRFVNSREGRRHRWRGMNAKVVVPGTVSLGDRCRKLDPLTASVEVPNQAATARVS